MTQLPPILVISRDSTAANVDSQHYKRIAYYDSLHPFIYIVLNVGEPKRIMVGKTEVILPGGRSLVGAFFKALKEADQQVKQQGCTVVTTQDVLYAGVIGYILKLRYKLRLLVQIHGDYLGNPKWYGSNVGTFNRLMNYVGVYILRRADSIRVVSNRIKKDLIKKFSIASEKMVSIPIGTPLDIFSEADVSRGMTMLFAQRLIPEKCPLLFADIAIATMQSFPAASVEIAGDGFLKGEMEKKFTAAGVSDRVVFHGMVDQPTLAKLYQSSYCYIHTADWEGWGMPMIEAMAAGCPVVTTDTGCAGEAVRHNETGLVTVINDTNALIAETARLYQDRTLWQSLAKAGIVEAQNWSFTTLTDMQMQWYGIKKTD